MCNGASKRSLDSIVPIDEASWKCVYEFCEPDNNLIVDSEQRTMMFD